MIFCIIFFIIFYITTFESIRKHAVQLKFWKIEDWGGVLETFEGVDSLCRALPERLGLKENLVHTLPLIVRPYKFKGG